MKEVKVSVRLCLEGEERLLGPGVCRLLEWIDRTGSVQAACEEMGLSYSKASHILKRIDKGLGVTTVRRWSGGTGGGGAALTEEGRKLVDTYYRMEADVDAYVRSIYPKYFSAL